MRLPFLEVLDLSPPEGEDEPQGVVLGGLFEVEVVYVSHDVARAILEQFEMSAEPRLCPTATSPSRVYGPRPYRRWQFVRSTRPRGLN